MLALISFVEGTCSNLVFATLETRRRGFLSFFSACDVIMSMKSSVSLSKIIPDLDGFYGICFLSIIISVSYTHLTLPTKRIV